MGGLTGGSGSQGNASTIDNFLPSATGIYLEGYLKSMYRLMNTGGFFTGEPFFKHTNEPTYATQNADEIEGIDRISKRANGIPFVGAPGDYIVGKTIISKGETVIRDTLDGLKINTNPKLDELWNRRKEAILQEWNEETLPRINSEANMMGAYGSSGHNILQAKAAEKVMQHLILASSEVYGNDYHAERELQYLALDLGITYAKQEINDADMLRQAGLYKREYEQGRLEDAYKIYKRESDRIVKLLEILGNAVRVGLGAQVSKTQPLYLPSTISQIAGVALSGASIASLMYSNSSTKPGMTPAPPSGPMPTYSPDSNVPHFDIGEI